jgi:hypothetical protein
MELTYDFKDFTIVRAGSAFQVEIVCGEAYSVTVTVEDRIRDSVRVIQEGNALSIRLEPLSEFLHFGVGRHSARITMPTLQGLDLSGASRTHVTGFNAQSPLAVALSGASSLEGDITAGDVRINASGASRNRLTGAAHLVDLDGSGASHLELANFSADGYAVSLTGASSATVAAREHLDCVLSGASHLHYSGSPRIGRSAVSGASSIASA